MSILASLHYKSSSLSYSHFSCPPFIHAGSHKQTGAHSWGQLVKLKTSSFFIGVLNDQYNWINKPISFGREGSFSGARLARPLAARFGGRKTQNRGLIKWVNYGRNTSAY